MIEQFSAGLLSGRCLCVEIAKEYIASAKKINKKTNAFVSFCDELALESAKKIDEKVKAKKPLGKLAGVPIAIKDNILVQGYPATAGSKMLEYYEASYDADVVTFLKAQDALIIGKTNMDEFAMGSSSETSFFGKVNHPLGKRLVPGGSSGGSAVAVASGQVLLALGSDTGGSIRQPASFTGTIGIKPTYGRVSRSGLIAMASSLDQIGVFSRDINDAGRLLEVIAKGTTYDSTWARKDFYFSDVSPEQARDELKTIVIGVPKEYFGEGLDPRIKTAVEKVLGQLERQKIRVARISLPSLEYALACYYIIMSAEASSNLARYDGIRYAPLAEAQELKSKKFEELYSYTRAQGFGKEVRRRIMLGTYVLSAGYIDKYYVQAQKVRQVLSQEFSEAFRGVDVIVGPTSPIFPFKQGEKLDDPLSMYLADIYTVAPNLAGLPALSLPLNGLALPAGLQLIAPHFEEQKLLTIAKGIEALT